MSINNVNAKQPCFSFNYGGTEFRELIDVAQIDSKCEHKTFGKEYEIAYVLPDNLKITWQIRFYDAYNACRWELHFENMSDKDTQLIKNLYDCDVGIVFDYDEKPTIPGYVIDPTTAKVFYTKGSNCERYEFSSYPEYLNRGTCRNYANTGGRSSQTLAPFFDVAQENHGVICAIGWSGQWNAEFCAREKEIGIKTNIEGLNFKLYPGEKIRTSSVLLLEYFNGQNDGHNKFRRLIKEHFSIIGMPGRPENGPLCAGAWGSLPSDKMIERIIWFNENQLGLEYYWIDAGWYGHSTQKCENEFVGDWASHTGSWNVNKAYHPDDLLEVARAAKENNMEMLLWIEPERVVCTTDEPTQHPDWFLKLKDANSQWSQIMRLLNLGNEEALRGTIEMVSEKIETLGLSCYRQDFNCEPLQFWREADEPERKGITEIKHIMGLYQFWDELLARFPHLIIDNCASGGRRIDIETLSRSIPLWRSDYQCVFDCDPETTQIHNSGISWWLPYSGTGVGTVMGDTYRIRSCYSAAMMTQAFWMNEESELYSAKPLDWARKQFEEYKHVRPYFSCDYYPLFHGSYDDTGWTGWQYDRPDKNDGIIMLFRRPNSPLCTAQLELGGLSADLTYHFKDADSEETFAITGKELISEGFNVTLSKKRSSKLLYYRWEI